MKGIANTIAESMDIEFTYEPVQKSFLHPYQAVKVLCEGYRNRILRKRQHTISKAS